MDISKLDRYTFDTAILGKPVRCIDGAWLRYDDVAALSAPAPVPGEVVVKLNINDLARYSPSFDEVGQACMREDSSGYWIHIPDAVLKRLAVPGPKEGA